MIFVWSTDDVSIHKWTYASVNAPRLRPVDATATLDGLHVHYDAIRSGDGPRLGRQAQN